MKSYLKVPMTGAIILEALSLLVAIVIYMSRETIVRGVAGGTISMNGARVFPAAIVVYLVMLIVYVIYLLVMSSYEGSSYKVAGLAMMVSWIVINIAAPYISSIQNWFMARKGNDVLSVISILSSKISMISTPLNIIASALVLVAIGRFSVENEYREAAPMGINPAVFGQGGYMPVQGYTQGQNFMQDQSNTQGQNFTQDPTYTQAQNFTQGQ